MLILTRKTGQGFMVGDGVKITITEISGDKVRVGIDAPKDIKILRLELTETVEQNIQAAGGAGIKTLRDKMKQVKNDSSVQVNVKGIPLNRVAKPAEAQNKEEK